MRVDEDDAEDQALTVGTSWETPSSVATAAEYKVETDAASVRDHAWHHRECIQRLPGWGRGVGGVFAPLVQGEGEPR